MPSNHPPPAAVARSQYMKTPAERAAEFAAEQARLKLEAAARRAAAQAVKAPEGRAQPAGG